MSIRVVVVDDSNLARRVLEQELNKDPDIEVVGTAKDALEASEKIEALSPDVLTLDMEMPKMDGLTFLRGLMRHHPMPVVVVSAYTKKGSNLAMEALESGAVDIVPKPGVSFKITEMTGELIAKVKAAAQAKVGEKRRAVPKPVPERSGITPGARAIPRPAPATEKAPPIPAPTIPDLRSLSTEKLPPLDRPFATGRIVAIGSSTGGTQALQYILTRLPKNLPPILIVQHMPAGFTKAFADRLNTITDMEVKEAQDKDAALPGTALIAPGGYHMVLRGSPGRYWVEINDAPKVCRQRPSVEVLFESVAEVAGARAVGVILTGMGNDGAAGMLKMKERGAVNIAQDEKSCVVFGMPKEAIKLGAANHVTHLEQIPGKMLQVI